MRDLHMLLHRIHEVWYNFMYTYICMYYIQNACAREWSHCFAVYMLYKRTSVYLLFSRKSWLTTSVDPLVYIIYDHCYSRSRNATFTLTHIHFNCLLSPDCTLTNTHTHSYRVRTINNDVCPTCPIGPCGIDGHVPWRHRNYILLR